MKNKYTISFPNTKSLFITIILFLSLQFSALAQRTWKDYLITGSSMMVSGMLDGTIESISYHYDRGFKTRFPKANKQFWDPSVSWKNKYKNGDCNLGPKFTGSTNILACTTDAYHMLRTTKRSIDGLTLAYYVNKSCSDKNKKISRSKKWKNIATDFVVLTAIRCIGFNLTYNVLFKQKCSYNN